MISIEDLGFSPTTRTVDYNASAATTQGWANKVAAVNKSGKWVLVPVFSSEVAKNPGNYATFKTKRKEFAQAVANFQGDNGLKVDGAFGPTTWTKVMGVMNIEGKAVAAKPKAKPRAKPRAKPSAKPSEQPAAAAEPESRAEESPATEAGKPFPIVPVAGGILLALGVGAMLLMNRKPRPAMAGVDEEGECGCGLNSFEWKDTGRGKRCYNVETHKFAKSELCGLGDGPDSLRVMNGMWDKGYRYVVLFPGGRPESLYTKTAQQAASVVANYDIRGATVRLLSTLLGK